MEKNKEKTKKTKNKKGTTIKIVAPFDNWCVFLLFHLEICFNQ